MSDAHLANVESFLFRGHQRRAVAAGHAGTHSCHGHPAARARLILPVSRHGMRTDSEFAGGLCPVYPVVTDQSPNRWAAVAPDDVTVADI